VSTTITNKEIQDGLANDPRFPRGSAAHRAYAPFLPVALLKAAGDNLDESLTPQTFRSFRAVFLRILLGLAGFSVSLGGMDPRLVRRIYGDVAALDERFATKAPRCPKAVHETGTRFIADGYPVFSPDTLATYGADTLTLRQVVISRPGIFLPWTG